MITILHRGGGVSLGTPKSDYVICARPLTGITGITCITGIVELLELLEFLELLELRELLDYGKKPNIPPKQKLYPRHIVTMLKERKILERVFKTAKSKFAGSIGDQVASNSLVIAKDNLDSMTAELNEAKSRFEGQQRGPLMNITKSKSKKDRRRFWDYVKRKTKKSLSFPPLQKKTTGVLVHSPQDISDEVFNYLKDIFSGSDTPPSTSSLAASISSDSTRHDNLLSHDHAQGKQDALPPQFEAPRPPPFPQAHLGDHAYCSNPNPVLNKTSSNCSPEQDPGGFLDKDFSIGEVNAMIKNLGNNKAAGHDDLINEALKEAPPKFIQLLTKLYNMVKARGTAPHS